MENKPEGIKYFQEPDGIPTNNRLDSMKGFKRFAPNKLVFGKLGCTK